MESKLPTPVCTVFLTCRAIAADSRTGDDVFVGLPRAFWSRTYPSATPISFLIRCTSAHGSYPVEVQLQSVDGEVVWKDGPADPLEMQDPLETYDLKMNVHVVFPAPVVYQFVLVLNGEKTARQRFHAKFGEGPGKLRPDKQE